MPTEVRIIATNDNIPPEVIGDVRIRVVVGQTVSITRPDMINSFPDYFHEFDRPLGGIKITGPGERMENFLMPAGSILATLTNNNQTLYQAGSIVVNGEISRLNLNNNLFKVKGNSIGSDYVEYVANSFNELANTTSAYIDTPAKLHIDVVSGTNRPPNVIGDNDVDCPIGVLVPLNINVFTFDTIPAYGDPENDPPLKIKIHSIPTIAILTFNGIRVNNGDEFFASDLLMGEMKAFFPIGTAVNTTDRIKFDVADVGSGQYSGL